MSKISIKGPCNHSLVVWTSSQSGEPGLSPSLCVESKLGQPICQSKKKEQERVSVKVTQHHPQIPNTKYETSKVVSSSELNCLDFNHPITTQKEINL